MPGIVTRGSPRPKKDLTALVFVPGKGSVVRSLSMEIHHPVIITARLEPGVKIGKVFISIRYSNKRGEGGRTRYHYSIDGIGRKSFAGDDLQSGAGGGGLQDGLETLLSFLEAAAESYSYRMRTGRSGENEDLFQPKVVEWAYQNSDEIGMLRTELEETKDLIEE